MSWQLVLLTAILSGGFMQIYIRVLMKDQKSDPILFSILFQLLAGFLVGIFIAFQNLNVSSILNVWSNLILMALVYGISNIFVFRSLKIIEASQFAIFYSSRALWTIIGAVIILGEAFSISNIIGALLIFLGITLVSQKASLPFKIKGIIFALIAALMQGLENINDAYIIRILNPVFYTSLAMIFPAILMLVLNFKSVSNIKIFLNEKRLLNMIILSVLFAITTVGFYTSYKIGGNIAQIAPIYQTVTIVTVILAAFFLKEREDIFKKIVAGLFASLGAILLI